jgi:hypothetical protein
LKLFFNYKKQNDEEVGLTKRSLSPFYSPHVGFPAYRPRQATSLRCRRFCSISQDFRRRP